MYELTILVKYNEQQTNTFRIFLMNFQAFWRKKKSKQQNISLILCRNLSTKIIQILFYIYRSENGKIDHVGIPENYFRSRPKYVCMLHN